MSGRARGRSHFFVAFRVLSPERRRGIQAVYRFCRRADDAVDEAGSEAEARASLDAVRRELEAAFAGDGAAADPELVTAIRAYGLPRAPFEELIEGVTWDLEGRRYATREELREYCRRVASTVGRLCVRVFGCGDGACDPYADSLGIAMQWTNILRDVGSDLARGRVYLPAASLAAHALTEDDLRRPTSSVRESLRGLVRDEAGFARERFAEASRALPAAWRRAVTSGEIMAEVYRALLRRVERAGDRVLDRKVRVGAVGRAGALARVLLRSAGAS